MNKKNNAPLTPFQIILILLDITVLVFCVAVDAFVLFGKIDYYGTRSAFKINLLLSVVAAVLLLVFVKIAGTICGFQKNENENREPVIKIVRTYICMLFFDFAGIIALMLCGKLFLGNVKIWIAAFGSVVIAVASVICLVRIGRIGFGDDD